MEDQPIIQFNCYHHNLDIHQVEKDLDENQDVWEDVFYEMIARERFGCEESCVENIVMVASPGQNQKIFKLAQGWNPYKFRWLNTDEKVTLSLHYEFLQTFLERDFFS